jgi:4-amino-4-deoxychorismate lyase
MMRTRVFLEEEGCFELPCDDRIFLGESLFETLRVEQSQPCFARLHWQRLNDSSKKIGMPFDVSYEHWLDYLLHKIKSDNLYHGGIKAILTGGSAPRGLAERGQTNQLLFQTFNYSIGTHPLRLINALWLRDANNPVYQVKSINYLEAIAARRQAVAAAVDDVLFYNLQGHALETTCANLFLLHDDCLWTPPVSDGVLPGITRSRILKISQQSGIDCREVSITPTMLKEASLLFITNSLQGIRPVQSLNDTIFSIEHPLLQQLSALILKNND